MSRIVSAWPFIVACAFSTAASAAPSAPSASAPPAATPQPPASSDLATLIECRSTTAGYGQLAFKVVEPDGPKQLGWQEVKQPNGFIREFLLPKEITVFGKKTKLIAFGSSSILAVLENTDMKALAKKLGLADASPSPSKLMFAKTITEESDKLGTTIVRLNVSTVDSLPGKTLAGCEYRFDVR